MEIPFDRKIAEAYSRGEPLIDTMPAWRDRFLDLYGRIENLAEQRKAERSE
jgi:MinD superfamily P-loop ATPase